MYGVFLDAGSVIYEDDVSLAPIRSIIEDWTIFTHTSSKQILKRIQDAQIIITNKVVLDRNVLQKAKNLKLICIAATGTNNIDLAAASELNIPVCNVRNYATPSVAEHTFALILILSRQLQRYHEAIQQQAWSSSKHFTMLDFPITELAGKTIGIIGYGTLGKAVAKIAEAFGMRVLIAQSMTNPSERGRVTLEEIYGSSDVISLHCPLTTQTKNLINNGAFAQMKSNAILINTARGGIVDESALVDALRSGKIRGAATDVLTTEPPAKNQILLKADLPNLLITPHIAWASVESRQRLVDQIGDNIASFIGGNLQNQVTA